MPANNPQPVRVAAIDSVEGTARAERHDYVVVEEPLSILLGSEDGSVELFPFAVTMRTPGHDVELAAGLIFTEGIVRSRTEITGIESRPATNEVLVRLKNFCDLDTSRLHRNLYMSASCGVCGKATIDGLYATGCERLAPGTTVKADVVHRLPELTREVQAAFEHTGALHAAALFDPAGDLLSIREDVGRHNALDKIIGVEFLAGRSMENTVALLSGRVGFELVQKCVAARIPVLAAVGAPSSLAIETARRFNVTVLGFVRDGRFNIYTAPERIA